jgi:hypothetical protein
MALIEVNRDPTPRQVRQFALLWLPGFCFAAAAWSVYRFDSWPAAATLAGCGVASIACGLLRQRWMRGVMIGWMWAAFPIGWIIAHTLMAAIYFLVVTPIGLLMRAAGRDPLARRFDREADTYWVPRTVQREPSSYFRQF